MCPKFPRVAISGDFLNHDKIDYCINIENLTLEKLEKRFKTNKL